MRRHGAMSFSSVKDGACLGGAGDGEQWGHDVSASIGDDRSACQASALCFHGIGGFVAARPIFRCARGICSAFSAWSKQRRGSVRLRITVVGCKEGIKEIGGSDISHNSHGAHEDIAGLISPFDLRVGSIHQ